MNTQPTANPGQFTMTLAIALPDLQDHLHRMLAQFIGGISAVLA